jgi:hypothetical protein
MRIVVREPLPEPGIRLAETKFGDVVRIAKSCAFYLVMSAMDGSGQRVLVSLGSGAMKDFNPDTRVIPVDAELHVRGYPQVSSEPARTDQARCLHGYRLDDLRTGTSICAVCSPNRWGPP